MAKYTFKLEDLFLSKSAQFYKLKKPMSRTGVTLLFRELSSNKIGRYLINERYKQKVIDQGEVFYSILSFKIEDEPTFLTGTDNFESKYAFLMILEINGYLVIVKKHIDSLEKELKNHIEYLGFEKFSHFHGRHNPEYEKISMNNMSISDSIIRYRAVEAKKLNGILSANTIGRSVPKSMRIKSGDDTYSLTPTSSRIGHRDTKVNFTAFIQWSIATIDELVQTVNMSSNVVSGFSTPIILQDVLERNIKPTAIFIDLSELDILARSSNSTITISKLVRGQLISLQYTDLNNLFNSFKSSFSIKDDYSLFRGNIRYKSDLKFRKSVVTFKSTYLNNFQITENGQKSISLTSYINKNKQMTMVFDNLQFCFYGRACFEDKTMMSSLSGLLSIFDDSYDFSTVVSEKEKIHNKKHLPQFRRFPVKSLFRKIENIYKSKDSIIICDDMNDEWADHIVLNNSSSNPSIKFIHSKFVNKDSYGASKFHEVVSQALKNIGRINAPISHYKEKYDKEWLNNYESTQISRIRPVVSSWNDIEKHLTCLYQNPNTLKEVILATPFLKKSELSTQIDTLKNTGKVRPHTVQLIWLINTFISSCFEVGIKPTILCKL